MYSEKKGIIIKSHHRFYPLSPWRFAMSILFLLFFIPTNSFADDTNPDYDEVLVFLNVNQIGNCEIPTVIRDKEIYLPIIDIFRFLEIKFIPTDGLDSISGFFIHQKNGYLIDRINNRIIYQEKIYDLNAGDLFRTETNLYLKSDYFGQIFGLECTFNFRSLSVSIKSKLELPLMRKMRLEQMRLNINRLKGSIKADTIIKRSHPFFHFGIADWSITTNQQVKGRSNTWFNLALGAMLAGGEFKGIVNYKDNQPFLEKNQYYLWRYVNNDQKAMRQVMIGKIGAQSISTILDPIVGVQVTNSSTIVRKHFGTHTLSNYTEPNWTVELYVNNVLVDYVKADASGFFTFDVPLIYGNTDIMLRYYGPWGEEKSTEENFRIPHKFLPHKEFVYTLSSGVVEDGNGSFFSQGRVNYGLSQRISVGGGVEYLSSISKDKYMPFLNTSIRLGSNLLFTEEYTYGVRNKGMLSYNLPRSGKVELHYAKYNEAQEAIIHNYNEELKAMISNSFKMRQISVFSRLTINNYRLHSTKYFNTELILSGSAKRVSVNLTTVAYYIKKTNEGLREQPIRPYVYNNLSLSLMFPKGVIFRPQISYEYENNKILSIQAGLRKHIIKHGSINIGYEFTPSTNLTYWNIEFRYDFSFAHIGSSVNYSKNRTVFFQSANGSLIYEPKTKFIDFNRNNNMGKAGIIFSPFLDMNDNGKKDNNEPKVSGVNIRVNGGGIKKNRQDTTIVILGLEPYINYFVELNANGFEYIAWEIKKSNLSIAINPNQLKLVEIPVAVVGEVAGMVYIKDKNEQNGIGRIKVCFYNNDSVFACTHSEMDGYFSFLGLSPGSYTASIDTTQLRDLQMSATPTSLFFDIHSSREGDVVDDLKFVLRKK
ncbi:hypothetical protein JYU20_01500 [Bacteroidales bacterium AH-315-I05]|nr:hypothetical protein [Bacteroidales bacterium AH-315-I05]